MASDMEDLVGFLGSPRAELRKSACAIVLGLTGSDEGVHQLVQLKVLQPLCRLVSDLRPIAEEAIKALINITAIYPAAAESALNHNIISRLFNLLRDDEWQLVDLAIMLLANVTTTEQGAKLLVEDTNGDSLKRITVAFMESEPEPEGVDAVTGESKWDDDYQYVANVLANISQIDEGRKFLLQIRNDQSLISLLIPQLHSTNRIRRRGCVGALRNLCFDTENHYLMYELLDCVSNLLFLLIGPEPLDDDDKEGMNPFVYRLGEKKKREPDAEVRRACVECLLLLCTTRNGRNSLRKKKVYPVVRNAHLVEDDESVSEQIYKLVDFLIRDEEGEGPDWDKVREESFKDDETQKEILSKETPKPAVQSKPKKTVLVKEKKKNEAKVEETVEEEVSADIAEALAKEILILDVSSDDESDASIDD